MKRSKCVAGLGSVSDREVVESYLPREVWILVFRNLLPTKRFDPRRCLAYPPPKRGKVTMREIWRMRAVCLAWKVMAGEAVLRIERIESFHLNDDLLKRCVSLRYLELDRNELITDAGISELHNISTLKLNDSPSMSLFEDSPSDSDSDMQLSITDAAVSRLTNLTRLKLDYNRSITDFGISGLTNLTCLSLEGSPCVTDDGISNLLNLQRLTLDSNRNISDQGVSCLSNLMDLDLANGDLHSFYSYLYVTDAGLRSLPILRRLVLSSNAVISDEGLSMLSNLTELDLTGNSEITDTSLTRLTNLVSLCLDDNTQITDCGVSSLTNLTMLSLAAFDSPITNQGIIGLTRLIRLDLEANRRVEGAAVSRLSNLTYLNLKSNKTVSVEGISGLSCLRCLRLNSKSRVVRNDVREVLPDVKIFYDYST